MKRILPISVILTLFLTIGCTTSEEVLADLDVSNLDTVTLLTEIANKNTEKSPRPQPPIWADCEHFTGIVVPATFKPESDPFDELYALGPGLSFAEGKPLISDSKPGDQDYNGGRWHLNVLTDPGNAWKYTDSCSEEDIIADGDLSDFTSTDMYFGCPLRPVK